MVQISMAPAVRLHEAVALAGRFPLLAGASLEVAEGEVVHLRGPNGAGKTSLLKVLAGLLEVHSGEATVLGRDLVADRRAVRREVGMLGHQSFLYEDLTVEENLRFAVRAARGSLAGIAPGARAAGFQRPSRLHFPSAGAPPASSAVPSLAVLVARGARLWLLDEPHAGLDQDGRDLLDELLAGSRAAGRTVLFASHEHERAEAIADRVVHLAGGRVVESARPVEPLQAPVQVTQPPGQVAEHAVPRPVTEAPAHVA